MSEGIMTAPHSFEAEQSVLGSIMQASYAGEHDKVSNIMRIVKPESFYSMIHATIFSAMRDLIRKSQPVDLITLDSCLSNQGKSEQIGGLSYLVELQKVMPSSANAISYAMIVREHAARRFAMSKLNDSLEVLMSRTGDSLADQMTAIQGLMAEVHEYTRTGKSGGLKHIRETAETWIDEIEARVTNPQTNAGYTTGIEGLDNLLYPKMIRKGSLNVIGARPKMGKTAFLLRILIHFAVNHKKPAAMFSLEMPSMELWERMVSQEARVNSDKFYTGMDDADYGKVANAMSHLINSNLYVDDTPGISLAHLQAECRKLKAREGEIGCVAVDYLTLMKAEKADRNDLAYGAITKGLKDLSKELDCPVFLLTQLNRGLESRTDKRPIPSDSRDTGQIEQDCDLWLGLYRESVYDPEVPQALHGITEAIVRLNRHGKSGTAHLNLVNGAFYDASPEDAGRMLAEKNKKDFEDDDF